jgi:hypothetical protein
LVYRGKWGRDGVDFDDWILPERDTSKDREQMKIETKISYTIDTIDKNILLVPDRAYVILCTTYRVIIDALHISLVQKRNVMSGSKARYDAFCAAKPCLRTPFSVGNAVCFFSGE